MTDTRQVLEEAWEHLCQTSLSFRRYACTTIPGGDGWTMTGKFCRFLDAEAWTDAALMLIPERYKDDYEIGPVFSRLGLDYDCADHWGWSDVPALSLVEACLAALRAKEAGDA